MMQKLLAFSCAAGAGLFFAGCDLQADRRGAAALPDGVVHVQHPAEGAVELRATEVLRIGAADGDPALAFGRIVGLALADDGRVYVLDAMASELRIFNSDGRPVRTVGGPGGGPGELRNARGMAWSPAGTLWILDSGNQRFAEVSADGDILATHRFAGPSLGGRWDGAVDAQGAIRDVVAAQTADDVAFHAVRYEVRDQQVAAADSVPVPLLPPQAYYIEAPFGMLNLPVPYAPRASWAFDREGMLWWGSGEAYRIWRVSPAGDTTHLLEVLRPRAPVSPAERAAAEQDLRDAIERTGGSASAIDFGRIPGEHPAHGRIRVDAQDRVWIARPYRMPGAAAQATTFDVLSPDGDYHAAVTLDLHAERPLAFARDRVAGVHADELGVLRVVVYRVE